MDEDEQFVLTAEERAGCAQVAQGGAPFSQRAQAILALADGATLAEAAAQADLTENQVKLWRGRFRNGRLAVFPAELLVVGIPTTDSPMIVSVESLPEDAPPKQEKAKKQPKNKKEKNPKEKKKEEGKQKKESPKKKDKKKSKKKEKSKKSKKK